MQATFCLFILMLMGCTNTPLRELTSLELVEINLHITTNNPMFVRNIFETEKLYLNNIPEEEFKLEIKNLLKSISRIIYNGNECGAGQVACSDPSHKGVIFINENFLLLPPLEQFTAFLHEASHLKSENFQHTKCRKILEWGYECDNNLDSPYGVEYKYMLHKYVHTKDNSITPLLLKIFNRINNI